LEKWLGGANVGNVSAKARSSCDSLFGRARTVAKVIAFKLSMIVNRSFLIVVPAGKKGK